VLWENYLKGQAPKNKELVLKIVIIEVFIITTLNERMEIAAMMRECEVIKQNNAYHFLPRSCSLKLVRMGHTEITVTSTVIRELDDLVERYISIT
jgi:hypothetical protein